MVSLNATPVALDMRHHRKPTHAGAYNDHQAVEVALRNVADLVVQNNYIGSKLKEAETELKGLKARVG